MSEEVVIKRLVRARAGAAHCAGPHRQSIALVLSSLEIGGVQRMSIALATEFARRGFRVDVVVLGPATTMLDQVPLTVRLIRLGARRTSLAIGRLRRYLARERPSSVLSAAWEPNLVTLLASLGLRFRPKVVLSVRNTFSLALQGGIRRRLIRLATRSLYPLADHVAVVSKGAAADLRRHTDLDAAQVSVIYNPALPPDFEALASAPAELFPPATPGRARIVTIGRLAPAKDQANLIRAFAQLSARRNAELFIFGEGEMRSALEQLVVEEGLQGRVTLAGAVKNPFPYMRHADLFVFSSAWEGFGNVLIEALASGVRIVSTDCPHGPSEILEGGKWGRLVPPGDSDALAEAMHEALSGPTVNGLARARQFTVERIADEYLKLLGE